MRNVVHGAMKMGLAAHAKAGRVMRPDASPSRQDAPLVHSYLAYRSGKCKCEICREDHNLKSREYRAKRKSAGYVTAKAARAARIEMAKRFLEDGCSYHEAAKSAGTDEHVLAKMFPDYYGNDRAWRSILTQIKNDEKLLQMHREVWQGATFAQS